MDKCREEFEKAFPIPAHWIEFDEKANRYYCPYVADATASTYQSKWVVWQHQQAKVEELKASHHGEVIGHEVHFKKIKQERDELQTLYTQQGINMLKLQKRVDELEFQLKDWKQKSMPAMLNGMCGRCGKEPLQGIGSDKEDYALLHCFGCGANKYEWIGEQALKGEG
ncbi:hypothetical protein ACT4V8_04205 [Acinetobacter baumannii]